MGVMQKINAAGLVPGAAEAAGIGESAAQENVARAGADSRGITTMQHESRALGNQKAPVWGANLREFYYAVLPPTGPYLLFHSKTKRHTTATSIDELVTKTRAETAATDTYFAVASFKAPDSRKGDNVALLKAHRIDIDAGAAKLATHGPDEVYATQKDARDALVAAVRAGLPAPTYIVSSGEGLHVYWALTEAVGPAEWKPVALRLDAAAKALGVKVDSVVTADTARVLRPLGTAHPNGRRVEVLRDTGRTYTNAALGEALAPLAPDAPLPAPAAPLARAAGSINDDILGSFQGPPASLAMVAQHCGAVAALRDTGGRVPEPHWRAVLGVAKYCEIDGAALAHEWSAGHPDYDARETQTKLDRWETPPSTCAHFATVAKACEGCKYKGKVTTPKQLGAPQAGQKAGAKSEAEQTIAELNTSYFAAPGNGKAFGIYEEMVDPESRAPVLMHVPQDQFHLKLANRLVRVPKTDSQGNAQTQLVPAAKLWLTSPARREYPGGIGLWPNGDAPGNAYNLWRGLAVQPAPGDVGVMLAHVHMVCGEDEKLSKYLLDWFAFKVQRPGERAEVAVALRGGRGVGKGLLVQSLMRILGSHALHISSPRMLVGDFNAHLRGALLVFADEAFWAGDKAAEGVLKALITEPTITINGKGKDAYAASNRVSVIFASNERWTVPAGADERRYFVLDVPAARRGDRAYFKRLTDWLNSGGVAHWCDFLLKRDICGFHPRDVPVTAALDRQKIASMSLLEKWVLEALDRGRGLGGAGEWGQHECSLPCGAATTAYDAHRKSTGWRGAQGLDSREIGEELQRIFQCGPAKPERIEGRSVRAWRLPALDEARARASKAFGLDFYAWGRV